ncbi:MAG TPA: MFS transporter [Bryobacteraceae bacterium]|nr:MFS transporter [Bryobacteraceae bacterium]
MQGGDRPLPTASYFSLNAANFFQAEMVGVTLPVLSTYLKEQKWSYDAIGMATATAGLGMLVFQAPAGWLTDKLTSRRKLFVAAALVTGACFAALPIATASALLVCLLLFVSGAAQSMFVPVLGALALGLAGHKGLNRLMGTNQGWNHAGNITAAVVAMTVIPLLGLASVFYLVGICSFLAAASVLFIREKDLDERVATGLTNGVDRGTSWTYLLRNRTVLILLVSIFLFHLANAPILPGVALYVKRLGGSDQWMTATVLSAQLVMVPVAWLAGRLCDSWGRKPVMAVAFCVLPIRILTYSFATSPAGIVGLQSLDGIGAGIYGVAVAAFSADLTRGKGSFNTLMGLFATALTVGGVAGPLVSGLLLQHLGFRATFFVFAGLAAIGTVVFLRLVPETGFADRITDAPGESDFRPAYQGSPR